MGKDKDKNLKNKKSKKSEIEKLTEERDEYLAGWQRALADYDNLKKEVVKDKSDFAKYATEQIVMSLLPILDNFDQAIKHKPDSGDEIDAWMQGVIHIRKQLFDSLEEQGLSEVEIIKEFDPEIHESVGEEESDKVKPGQIIRIEQNGYRLKEKLIRPAKVIICK